MIDILKYIDEMQVMYGDKEPSSMDQEPRNMYNQGQLVQPNADGSRPGYGDAIVTDEIKALFPEGDFNKHTYGFPKKHSSYEKVRSKTRTKERALYNQRAEVIVRRRNVQNKAYQDPIKKEIILARNKKYLNKPDVAAERKKYMQKRYYEGGQREKDIARLKGKIISENFGAYLQNPDNILLKDMIRAAKTDSNLKLIRGGPNNTVVAVQEGEKIYHAVGSSRKPVPGSPKNSISIIKHPGFKKRADFVKQQKTFKNTKVPGKDITYGEALDVLESKKAGTPIQNKNPAEYEHVKGVAEDYKKGQIALRTANREKQVIMSSLKNGHITKAEADRQLKKIGVRAFIDGKYIGAPKINPEKQFKDLKKYVDRKINAAKGSNALSKELKVDLLKLAGTVNKKCKGALAYRGRVAFQNGLSADVCINEGKKVARDLIVKNREGTLAQKSVMKRVLSGTNKFLKSVLNPKELFDLKKQFFSKGALMSIPLFDGAMAFDDVYRKGMDPKEAFAKTLTFGSIPRAMGFTDSIDVINAKKMLEDPSLSPAGKEYAQLIVNLGDYDKMQSDTTGGMTKKFTEFKEIQEKIKNASTAGRFDYESALAENADKNTAGEYVGEPNKVGPGSYLAFDGEEVRKVNEYGYARKGTTFDAPDKPNITPLVNKLAKKATSRGPMTSKKNQAVDLSPTTRENFKVQHPYTKKEFENYMRKEGNLPVDQVYQDDFYKQEIERPEEFRQLMELPSFRSANKRFATGGRAGYMGGGITAIRRPNAIPPKRQGLRSILINGKKS